MALPLPSAELEQLLALDVTHALRRLQGRETFAHRAGDGRPIVVKRSRRGARPGAAREHAALEALARAGLAVPAALGALSLRAGSVVAMERVPHRTSAREALARAGSAGRRALLARVAALAASLHQRGWCHRDLYLQHVLVREPDGELVLIDVGRAGRARRSRWFVKDLAALVHSLPAEVLPRERLRLLAAYLDARGIRAARARRRWVARALAKARRMGARVPKDERGAREPAR